jgi:hypothetical protein
MPESTRCSWPLHQVPTRSTASGYAWPHSHWRRDATVGPAPPAPSVSGACSRSAWGEPQVDARAGLYPSPAPGTVRCWYGTRTAEDTSHRRFFPEACAGCANAPRSRSQGLQGVPDHQGTAPRLWLPATPERGRVGGVQRRYGGGVVWLWRGVFDRLWRESWCASPSRVCAVRRSVREPGTADRVPRGQTLSGRCPADT